MSKFKITMRKKSSAPHKRVAQASPSDPVQEFELLDNEDNTLTFFGISKGGNRVDISDVATLAVVSDNPAVIAVDPPVSGMTCGVKAGSLGTANLAADVTWNDGSIGPFGYNLPGATKASAVGGLGVELGTPTPR